MFEDEEAVSAIIFESFFFSYDIFFRINNKHTSGKKKIQSEINSPQRALKEKTMMFFQFNLILNFNRGKYREKTTYEYIFLILLNSLFFHNN